MVSIELVSAIATSVVAVITVISSAVQSIWIRRLESREKETSRLSAIWTDVYCEFCSAFARYAAEPADRKASAIQIAENAYKLSALCDDSDAYCFIQFADLILNSPAGFDEESLYFEFHKCAKIARENLKQLDK